MDIYSYIEDKIFCIISEEIKVPHGITVEPCRNLKFGDIATNAPIILSKIQDKSIAQIGAWLSDKIKMLPEVSAIDIAGAGFLNVKIKNHVWQNVISDINKQGVDYGSSNYGDQKVINIESVSANPTGPLHIGHARAAVFFSALSKLLEKVGYKVIREYYINDAGAQIDALTESLFLRYKEALGYPLHKNITYPGEYLKTIGEQLVSQYTDSLLKKEDSSQKIIKDFAINTIMSSIKNDLESLGIKHDIFIFESNLYNKAQETIDILDKKGLIYEGALEDPKGMKHDDWHPHQHLLFKSTIFGDGSDRSLKKADGSWTYFAFDIAHHLDKIHRGFHNIILGLGIDHAGYVKRIKGAVNALADNVNMNIQLYNIVHLFEDGAAIKMSKRSGKFLTVKDLINHIGADVVKYMMLTRKHDVVLDIDLAASKEQSQNNPIFYVQYAHARACSILRHTNTKISDNNLNLLSTDKELCLMKLLAKWPRVVHSAAQKHAPHRITNYLQELSESFHALWHAGNKSTSFRFIVQEDYNLTDARSALVNAVKNVIASGLNIISIKARNTM